MAIMLEEGGRRKEERGRRTEQDKFLDEIVKNSIKA
jgi:hypothetical protein